MARIAEDGTYVRQRGGPDCIVATLATVTGPSYETIAAAFGLSIPGAGDCATIAQGGIHVEVIPYPMFTIGWAGSIVVAKENEGFADHKWRDFLPTRNQIGAILPGKKAIIGYIDDDPKVGFHSLAWDCAGDALDCSDGQYMPLDEIVIQSAVILTRIP